MSPQTKISQSAGTTAMCSCKTLDIPSRKYRDFSGTVYTWLIWISLSILNNYFFRTTQNTTSSRFCCTIIPSCSSQRTKRPIPPECHFARGCLCFGESLCIRIPLNQIDYFHPSKFRTRIYHQTLCTVIGGIPCTILLHIGGLSACMPLSHSCMWSSLFVIWTIWFTYLDMC